MWREVGFRKTLKVLRSFPGLILMPMVTVWVVGPTRKQCLVLERNGANGNMLVVSFLHTWLNACVMLFSQLLIFFLCTFPGEISSVTCAILYCAAAASFRWGIVT